MTDVAQCPSCHHVCKVSDTLNKESILFYDIGSPPQGAWIKRGFEEIVIGANTRHWIALFLVPFALGWSGVAIKNMYWDQIQSGRFDLVMSLFGIPFLLVSMFMLWIALLFIFGKEEFTIDQKGGKLFTGVGRVGLTRRFAWEEITQVKESFGKNNQGVLGFALEGKKRVSVNFLMNDTQRDYLYRSLQSILLKVQIGQNFI